MFCATREAGMSENQHDFTHGRPLRQLIIFSGPIILANLLQTSFQLIDSLWVGNLLGAGALAAVAVSATILFTVLSFVIGMNNAALVILSQLKGRRDTAGLSRYLNAFVILLVLMSIGLGLAGFFATGPLLRLLGTPEAIMSDATAYLQISFLGMLFLFGYNFIAMVLRALGDSKTPMKFVFVAVLLNAIIDPLFIHTFGLGIRGAAAATVVSQGVAFLYGIITVISKKLAPFSLPKWPTWVEIRTILNLGIPSGLQMAVISGGSAAIMSVVNSLGADVVGGFGAAQRLDSLIMLPAQALSIAVSSMAGQNIGVRNWSRVTEITRAALALNLAVMLTIAAVIVTFAEPAVRLFIQDEAAVAFGTNYLRFIGFFYPFLGINFVLNGVVRASGAMYQVLVLNIISFWVLRFPLTFVFTLWIGEPGIAAGMGVSFVVSSLFAFLYFRFGKWRQKVIFHEKSTQ
ncbi:MAG: MATE family efflux transporter [Canibacter sp.]